MRNDSFKPFRALRAAALALTAAFGFAAAAAAEPVFSQTETGHAPPGVLVGNYAERTFANAGTNPRFTEAVFSTTEYYDIHRIDDGRLYLRSKTDAELNALTPPPASPFTVDVTVTMTNDEGQTASGTLTLETTYERGAAAAPPQPEEPAAPVFSQTETGHAPPGVLVGNYAERTFANAGTNPRFTEAVFSTTEYYDIHRISEGRLYLRAKTAAELNALTPPPASPFTVDVTVTMTNDEGQTASGTLTLETTYERDSAAAPPQPEEPAAPVFSQTGTSHAPPGVLAGTSAERTFANAGTNPRFTEAVFSTTAYYDIHRISEGRLYLRSRTDAELNALASPPPSPFTVDVTVTMTNDEGQTASGTLTFETTYERDAAAAPSQ